MKSVADGGVGVVVIDSRTSILTKEQPEETKTQENGKDGKIGWDTWAIFCTLGDFLKRLATINLPKSPTFVEIIFKGLKIYHFSGEIIFGQLL